MSEVLKDYTPTQLLALINDAKKDQEQKKAEILTLLDEIKVVENNINKGLDELSSIETRYVKLMEELTSRK